MIDPYILAGIITNIIVNFSALYIGYKRKNYPVMILLVLNQFFGFYTLISPLVYLIYELISYLIRRKAIKKCKSIKKKDVSSDHQT